MLRLVAAWGIVCCLWARPLESRAQATTVARYQELALRCLAGVPDTLRAFRLEAPGPMPYLRPPLVARWQADGRTLYVPDSTAAPAGLPLVTFRTEEARVAYTRAGRRRLGRTVTLALHYTVTDAAGRLLAEDRCRETSADTLDRRALAAVESGAYPETRAELPAGGWLRRYAEPALLTAATAVGVYLFFTLRSQAAGEGE